MMGDLAHNICTTEYNEATVLTMRAMTKAMVLASMLMMANKTELMKIVCVGEGRVEREMLQRLRQIHACANLRSGEFGCIGTLVLQRMCACTCMYVYRSLEACVHITGRETLCKRCG